MSIVVGSLALDCPVLLAPMSGITDLPFRRLVKRFGVGLVFSEMIASRELIRRTRRSLKMAASCADEQPMAVQLAGTEPDAMAEAARLNEDLGAALIDINFGCPVKKVVNKAAGSAIMRDERLAARILEAVVGAVSVPVTLKMRTGWDDSSRNAPQLARTAEACGVRMITVHGRTRCQLYDGRADWRFIARVKAATRLPVIANGDIQTVDDARRCLEESGADGLMIGRGACGRPWFPAQVARALADDRARPDPALTEVGELVGEHYDAMLSHYGSDVGVRIARKHLSWYGKWLSNEAAFRVEINRTERADCVRRLIAHHFGGATLREAA